MPSTTISRLAAGNFDYLARGGLCSWYCLVCNHVPTNRRSRGKGVVQEWFKDHRNMRQSAIRHAGSTEHLRNCLEFEAVRDA